MLELSWRLREREERRENEQKPLELMVESAELLQLCDAF